MVKTCGDDKWVVVSIGLISPVQVSSVEKKKQSR